MGTQRSQENNKFSISPFDISSESPRSIQAFPAKTIISQRTDSLNRQQAERKLMNIEIKHIYEQEKDKKTIKKLGLSVIEEEEKAEIATDPHILYGSKGLIHFLDIFLNILSKKQRKKLKSYFKKEIICAIQSTIPPEIEKNPCMLTLDNRKGPSTSRFIPLPRIQHDKTLYKVYTEIDSPTRNMKEGNGQNSEIIEFTDLIKLHDAQLLLFKASILQDEENPHDSAQYYLNAYYKFVALKLNADFYFPISQLTKYLRQLTKAEIDEFKMIAIGGTDELVPLYNRIINDININSRLYLRILQYPHIPESLNCYKGSVKVRIKDPFQV